MITRQRFLILIGCLAIAGLVGLFFLPREPRFQGRRLSSWLEDYGQGQQKNQQVNEAVRQIGTESLPWLLRMLKSKDSTLKLKVVNAVTKLGFKRIRFIPAEEWRKRAAWAVMSLGEKAKPALPDLVNLFGNTQTVVWATAAVSGLGWDAVPVLCGQMTNPDDQVRSIVSSAILKLCLQPGAKDHRVEVIPLLLRNLSDAKYNIRSDAAGALGAIAESSTAVPSLMVNLRDTNVYVCAMTAQALGRFGTNAAAAVPTLLELSKNQDSFLHDKALEALKQIQPGILIDFENQK